MESRMMGDRVQEKAAVFAGSRLEKPVAEGYRSDQWRKACCGGGCCQSTKLISSRFGAKPGETTLKTARAFDQSQPAQQRNAIGYTDVAVIPDTSNPIAMDRGVYNCDDFSTVPMNIPRGFVGPSAETGVCPAMQRNLPCTSYREPKCFGGGCRDEESSNEEDTGK